MKLNKALLVSGIAALLLVLAACSGGSEAHRPSSGTVTVSVGLDSGDLASLGVPFDDETGLPAVETVLVWVSSGEGPISFELDGSDYVAADGGDVVDYITLSGGAMTKDVQLPLAGNPYTFTALAYDLDGAAVAEAGFDHEAVNAIAFGVKTQSVFDNTSVAIKLTSILANDEADAAVVLLPRMPLTAPAPGMTIDFMLFVYSAHNGAGPYLVPLEDFELGEAGYAVTNAQYISSSKRGVRVEVEGSCQPGASLSISVEVTGLASATSSGNTTPASATAELSRPCFVPPLSQGSSVFTDMVPPSVTIEGYGLTETGGNPTTISGTATDNLGIWKVHLYDGAVLVASTEATDGVAPIEFNDGANPTAFTAALPSPSTSSLVAYAWDYWGNQAASIETVNPNHLYVDSCSDYDVGNGDGSLAFPFKSIHDAVEIVWENGTIEVAPNDGCAEILTDPVNITVDGISIIGVGHDRSVTALQDETLATSSFVNGGFEVDANDVTISGLHFSVSGTPEGFPDTVAGTANPTGNVYIWLTKDAAEESNLTVISRNVFVGAGSQSGDTRIRAIVNGTLDQGAFPGIDIEARALIEHNWFTSLSTGVFAWKGADFTIRHNRFDDNRAGSVNLVSTSSIVDNVFSDNLEGISLEAPSGNPEIHNNCFAELTRTAAVHIRSYVVPLEATQWGTYSSENDFEVGNATMITEPGSPPSEALIDFADGPAQDCG